MLTLSFQVIEFCEELYLSQGCTSPHLLAFLIDAYEERCLRHPSADAAVDKALGADDRVALSEKVLQLCALMRTKHDVIREKYWEYVSFNFRKNFEKCIAASELVAAV